MPHSQQNTLLDVVDLKTYFYTDDGVVKAVDGVSFQVMDGEVLGLVGESGCGKSVTSISIMGLIDSPGKIEGGKILFEGTNLLEIDQSRMDSLRGNQISMIFQQPLSSLNPLFTIGNQVMEVLLTHSHIKKEDAWEKAVELLKIVGMPDPEKKAKSYPHEISGGQAQRVMIAIALALSPKLLIADEPTTALDVTVQAQILDLMKGLRSQFITSIIFITHDLGVIAEMADRVAIMYAGKIVEDAATQVLFDNPKHPYTLGLMASVPVLGQLREELDTIPGNVPNLVNLPAGCRFASRCQARLDHNLEICTLQEPDLIPTEPGHEVRCWLYQTPPEGNLSSTPPGESKFGRREAK
jgi:oligopeptide/dipeptide ABC transporter ATP-binding protein